MDTNQGRRSRRLRPLTAGLLAVLPLAAATAIAAPAHADQPDKVTLDGVPTTQVSTSLCDFPVTITGVQTGFLLISDDGTVILGHATEQDTFTGPTGNTLTSRPYTYNARLILDAEGNEVSLYATGQVVVVPLPDGSTFRAAGRVDWSTVQGDFAVTPTNGGSQNLDGFCAALAG